MELNTKQQEVLTELINVGIGKAAAILSSMISQQINIHVPVVETVPYSILTEDLLNKFGAGGVGVSIDFEGDFAGSSTLIFGKNEGKTLVDQLLAGQEDDWDDDDDDWDDDFDASDGDETFTDTDKEAIVELGNMMINGLMGSMGNLLESVFDYKPPLLDLSMDFNKMYTAEPATAGEDQVALIMKTDFKAEEDENISGYLILIFELAQTFQGLISAIDRFIAANDSEDDF